MRRTWLWALAGMGAVLAIRAIGPFRIEVRGSSMEPSLRPGDWLLATRAGHRLRGRIVVARDPRTERDLVKRIAGVPGERVAGVDLGEDEYLLLGDAPDASTDGRQFGAVGAGAIEGIVRFRYWPRPAFLR